MKNKGFTITELLVAVGLLAVVLAACGIIFNYSIDAQRTASATSEIMRNLRAITDQLNADFAGLRKDAPLVVKFENSNGLRADSVVFFSTGDFQTTNTYSGDTIRGNVARIYYGQAYDPNLYEAGDEYGRKKILTRKQVIIAPSKSTPTNEYDSNSLIQTVKSYLESAGTVSDGWLWRPTINTNDGNDIQMYLAKGVDNFTITVDNDVNSTNRSIEWWPDPSQSAPDFKDYPKPYPDLIKFNFTLYDSKGILKTGRRFEHIVYIGK